MDLRSIVQPKKNPKIPDFRPGDTVRVLARVVEGERERVQAFEGVVIRKRRGGINSNFTVRRVTYGIGVERTFLLHSPRLESVGVVRVGRVRRAKLYYLRKRVGRKARVRAGSRDRFEELTRQLAEAGEELPEGAEEEAAAEEAEAEGVEEEAEAEAEAEDVKEAEEAAEAKEEEEEEAAEEPAAEEAEEAETEEEKAPEE
ncbi:MAG: 50S ribosomal protein L19 [Dehalococcoidia bacterium]|nr:MAG: 50S ribosomal protein L19 [Dehalococcoidia bacterium]